MVGLQELKESTAELQEDHILQIYLGGCIHIYLHIAEILLLRKMEFWDCCMSLNNHQCHFFFLWGCKRGQIPNPELNHHGPLSKPGNPKSQVLAETHPPSFNCSGAVFCFPFKWRTSCWEKPCFCCKRMEGHAPPIWTYKEPNKSNPTFVHAL